MIAKCRAIAHGSNAIHYAMKEKKMDRLIAVNMVEGMTPPEIIAEFEQINRHNTRCKNKYLRIEIGIAPPDEQKMDGATLGRIVREFSERMKLEDHQ